MIRIETLKVNDLIVGYDKKIILNQINVSIPKGKITVLIGSNGCGKSTLLKTMARLLKPIQGDTYLNDQLMREMDSKKIARTLSVLPQTPVAPEAMTVLELVRQGRYPYKKMFKSYDQEDEQAVLNALKATNTYELRDREVQDLSGGQRQRVWIAMVLAQDTEVIFLDEPTTYLDLAHQIDILDLLQILNEDQGKTIVMVLHDLNLAARYADYFVVVANQKIYSSGAPEEVMTKQMLEDVFSLKAEIERDYLTGTPICVPYSRRKKKTKGDLL